MCKIDYDTVASVTGLVEGGAQEHAVHRTGVHAQGAEYALRVVDLERGDQEPLTVRVLLLVDVDAVHRAGAGALVAPDAGGQVEPVEAPVAGTNRDRPLRVLEVGCKRLAAKRLDHR